MKRILLFALLVFILPVAAQSPAGAPVPERAVGPREVGVKPAGTAEEEDGTLSETPAEEQPNTEEKIERATEEVGRALGPIGELFDWFSKLPAYWEAFLVGGVCLVVLFVLYGLALLGLRRIMKKRGKPEWRLARRYNFFLRLLLVSLAVIIALVWVGADDGWFYTVVVSLASLCSAFLLINVFSYLVLERSREKKQRKPLPVLFQQVIRGLLYLVALFAVLGTTTELDLSAVLASSAMLSLVLGLALQDTLGNVFAGMSIHASKPFEIGDWVAIKEFRGQVTQMNWREVRIRTFEGDYIILPNSVIASSDIYNYSRPTTRHIARLEIGTSYADPPEKVRRVVRRVLEEVEGIEPTENHLYLLAYNDFSINYRVRFYIDDYSQVNRIKAEVMNRLWYAFQRAGITIPFPIRNVYLHRPQEEEQEERALASSAARLELLRGVDLFASLSPDILEGLARAFKTRMYATGEAPVRQGEEGDSFYLVKSGRFDIFVKKDRERHRYGVKVAELGPGSFFGEMSLLTGEARTATVVAREPGEVCALGKEDFREILLTRPEVSAQLAAAASERVTRNLAQLSKYLSEEEQKTMAEKEKKDHVRQAIMGQMRQFFGF